MKRNCFTLVELVIVGAVFLMLGMVVLSAQEKASSKNGDVKCKDNLRRLAAVQSSYANDYGCYFSGYVGFKRPGNRNMWTCFVWDQKYVTDPTVLSCPDTLPAGKFSSKLDDGYFGYGLVSWSCTLRTGFYHQAAPLEKIVPSKNLDRTGFSTKAGADNGLGSRTFAPDHTILFADSLQTGKPQKQPYGIAPRREGYAYKFGLSHDCMCNTVMNDGHSETLDQDSLIDDYGSLASQIMLKE